MTQVLLHDLVMICANVWDFWWTLVCIYFPQFSAYVLIAVFSALVIIVVGVYDCCISGKCESCSSHLLSCWRPTEEVQSVGQDNVGRDSVRLGALHDTTQNQRVIPTSEEQNVW